MYTITQLRTLYAYSRTRHDKEAKNDETHPGLKAHGIRSLLSNTMKPKPTMSASLPAAATTPTTAACVGYHTPPQQFGWGLQKHTRHNRFMGLTYKVELYIW